MEISLKVDGGLRVVWAGRREASNNELNKNKNLWGFTPQILSYLPWATARVMREGLRGPEGPLFRVTADGCAVLTERVDSTSRRNAVREGIPVSLRIVGKS